MTGKTLSFFLFVSINIFWSCNDKEDLDEKLAKEDQKLVEYITTNKSKAVRLSNGTYMERSEETGIQPEAGDYVLIDYTCSFLDGTMEVASDNSYYTSNQVQIPPSYKTGGPELWELSKPLYGVHVGIGHMNENQSAGIYVPSRFINMDLNTRIFDIRLRKIVGPDLKTYQEKLMSDYLKKQYGKEIDSLKIRDNNKEYYVMYHITNPGTDKLANISQIKTQTKEHYLLMDDDIRLCHDFKSYEWTATNMTEIFKKIGSGGEFVMMMPYKLKYGDSQYTVENNGYAQFVAPPGCVLLYEVKVN